MKKNILLILVCMLCLFLLGGCGQKKIEEIPSNTLSEKEEVVLVDDNNTKDIVDDKDIEEETKDDVEKEDLLSSLNEDIFKRIDGSTATIPVSENLALSILGDDADLSIVKHSTTPFAYERLINGDVDLIFVTPPSEEEQKQLEAGSKNDKDKARTFELERFAKEGFVFLANKNNKIEDLSVEDIRKIYKKEITNWKDVGGDDAKIRPYQREDGSGSQTLMYKLIAPKSEISDNATVEIVETMMGLVEAVANYDEGKDSLGYSVYYYINDMIDLGDSKLLKVNGVLPSVESIKDGSYPLVDGYYMVYNANLDPDDDIYKIINYLRSEDGQKMIEEAGYVPVK